MNDITTKLIQKIISMIPIVCDYNHKRINAYINPMGLIIVNKGTRK